MDGKDLLVEALGNIEMNPETWNQSVWECGTAACLAGHMARLDNEVIAVGVECREAESGVVMSNRKFLDYGDYVKFRLGLDYHDESCLTHPDNNLNDLRTGVKAVLNGENVGSCIDRERSLSGYYAFAYEDE